jgi:hypothetical protein
MATAGLVDANVIDLITAGSSYVDANRDRFIDKRTFYAANGAVAVLTRKLGADSFTVESYSGGRRINSEVKEYLLAKQASDAMEMMAKRLVEKGWAEL